MTNKAKNLYRQIAQAFQLRFDEEYAVVHGTCGGYQVLIQPTSRGSNVYYYMPQITVSAACPAGELGKEECRNYKKEHTYVSSISQSGRQITLIMKNCKKTEQLIEAMDTELRGFVSFLRSRGYEPCCQLCGQPVQTDTYFVSGGFVHMCPDCYISMNQQVMMKKNQTESKSENIIGGIVGAVLGSLIGVACIIVLSQLGYVAALSGVVMAVCTLKGYELLGGKLSKAGIIICSILMLVMTYLGDRIDWALVVARDIGMGFASSFGYIPTLVDAGVITASSYWANLLLVYLFVLLGAVPTIINTMKNKRTEGTIQKLA